MTTAQHGTLSIRRYQPGDELKILSTFNTVFQQECGDSYKPRTLHEWNWQYLDNPAGTQILLAVAADGSIASQYAAVPQMADTEHGPCRFVHVVDSMTHPDYRQGLQREGLFAALGRQFTADYEEHGNELGYGLPVRIAERIGRRLLDYTFLRTVEYWLRDPNLPTFPSSAAIRLEHNLNIPAAADSLWQRCLPKRPCAVRKDRAYLQWRYAEGPNRDSYMRISAWRGDDLAGMLMLRPQHDLIPNACTIADLVCHDEDESTARALLGEACRIAQLGKRTLLAVFADHDPHARRMGEIGAKRMPSAQWLERRLTYRITGPHSTPEQLETLWRYSLGDTDLC
jgi:hypothetical protein